MDFKELEFDSLDFELIQRYENDEISSSNVSYNKATNFVIAKRTPLHGRDANGISIERV